MLHLRKKKYQDSGYLFEAIYRREFSSISTRQCLQYSNVNKDTDTLKHKAICKKKKNKGSEQLVDETISFLCFPELI